jgi:hypothetical protein
LVYEFPYGGKQRGWQSMIQKKLRSSWGTIRVDYTWIKHGVILYISMLFATVYKQRGLLFSSAEGANCKEMAPKASLSGAQDRLCKDSSGVTFRILYRVYIHQVINIPSPYPLGYQA